MVLTKELNKALGAVQDTLHDAQVLGGNAVVLALSKAWIGISTVKKATTLDESILGIERGNASTNANRPTGQKTEAETDHLKRHDYEQLYYLAFDNYVMPLSQTFQLKAKKNLNISSLVDGIDIIQQTRKEAKTINVTLRIGLNKAQENLQILRKTSEVQRGQTPTGTQIDVTKLSIMLANLYESDRVFKIENDTINNTFGVEYCIMQDYNYRPRVGVDTYEIDFTLMEVKNAENTLTLDLGEMNNGQ